MLNFGHPTRPEDLCGPRGQNQRQKNKHLCVREGQGGHRQGPALPLHHAFIKSKYKRYFLNSEKSEFFLDVFGNSLIRQKSQDMIDQLIQPLIKCGLYLVW